MAMAISTTKVMIHGLPHASRIIAYWLNKHGFVAQVGNIISVLKLKTFHVIHFVYSPTIKVRGLLLFPLLKISGKKIIVHWVGSDVFGLLTRRKMRVLNNFTKNLVDEHLACSPWLFEELTSMGVKSKVISLVPNLQPNVMPLPDECTLLAYLPEKRYEFYGGRIVEKLADEFPTVKFLIVGNDGANRRKKNNIEYLGHIPYKEMPQIYRKVRGLIRMPLHDGMSLMVIESLLHGRYVIYSKKFPYCFHARNFKEAKKYVKQIIEIDKPNYSGTRYVQRFISESVKKLLETYKRLLGG